MISPCKVYLPRDTPISRLASGRPFTLLVRTGNWAFLLTVKRDTQGERTTKSRNEITLSFTRHTAFTHQGWSGFDARINDLNEAAHARLTPNLRCRWKVLMEELLHANSLSSLTLVRRRSRRTVKRCTRAR